IRPIGVLAHELRVHGDERLFREAVGESLEVVRLSNQRMDTHVSARPIASPSRVDKRLIASEARRAFFRTSSSQVSNVFACTPTAPIPAPNCAKAMSVKPSG